MGSISANNRQRFSWAGCRTILSLKSLPLNEQGPHDLKNKKIEWVSLCWPLVLQFQDPPILMKISGVKSKLYTEVRKALRVWAQHRKLFESSRRAYKCVYCTCSWSIQYSRSGFITRLSQLENVVHGTNTCLKEAQISLSPLQLHWAHENLSLLQLGNQGIAWLKIHFQTCPGSQRYYELSATGWIRDGQ